jgi:hypothetical protein
MLDHNENPRVTAPEDHANGNPSKEDKLEYGRQLAMDRIVLDECRRMKAVTSETRRDNVGARRSVRRQAVWIGAGLAASIAGVWAILAGTGALNFDSDASPTNREATKTVHRDSPSDPNANPPSKNTGVASPNLDVPGKSATAQDTPKKKASSKETVRSKGKSGKIADVLPDPGVKLKKRAIPKPNSKGEIPIPAGADPEDIKLIRSAVAMFEAEARLAKMVKAGLIQGVDRLLTFDEISSWPYEDGLKGMPEKVKKLDGKKVLMTGFMLPIDAVENIREFLLVESLWSCCYGQPPDINGTVRVILKGDKRTDYEFEPIKLVGTFRVETSIEDGFCVDVFQLEVERVEVIEEPK